MTFQRLSYRPRIPSVNPAFVHMRAPQIVLVRGEGCLETVSVRYHGCRSKPLLPSVLLAEPREALSSRPMSCFPSPGTEGDRGRHTDTAEGALSLSQP